ncbi:hypothetical protein [Roseateles violae]|uniref:Uncharacterized protein n=1 Tax=Roseateles violae TaxID=3058042 RepID=A0ABT8DRC5_9BURK|nr:hypothetical protein [Pelomonas sp. PFR6]MDN3920892.1 hypothetical protein [Pelomonas sp. PFR6]
MNGMSEVDSMCSKPNVFSVLQAEQPPAAPVAVPGGSRRRISKLLGGNAIASDYELHCGVINDCGQHAGRRGSAARARPARVYLESPTASGLRRALASLGSAGQAEAPASQAGRDR